jgi:hypothetical protein
MEGTRNVVRPSNGNNQLLEIPGTHQTIPSTSYLMPRIPYTMTHTLSLPIIGRAAMSNNASSKPIYRRGKVRKHVHKKHECPAEASDLPLGAVIYQRCISAAWRRAYGVGYACRRRKLSYPFRSSICRTRFLRGFPNENNAFRCPIIPKCAWDESAGRGPLPVGITFRSHRQLRKRPLRRWFPYQCHIHRKSVYSRVGKAPQRVHI